MYICRRILSVMTKGEIKQNAYKMFKWALRKIIEEIGNDKTISLGELKFILSDVWKDMVEDGEIHIID